MTQAGSPGQHVRPESHGGDSGKRAMSMDDAVSTLTNQQKVAVTELGDTHLSDIQAAGWLGLSVNTLRKWRSKGGGPPFVKIGCAVRYRMTQLEAWLEANTHTHTAQY